MFYRLFMYVFDNMNLGLWSWIAFMLWDFVCIASFRELVKLASSDWSNIYIKIIFICWHYFYYVPIT